MAFIEVTVDDCVIRLTAWCPRDALSELYCEMVLRIAREAIGEMNRDDARARLERDEPDTRELFRLLEQGYRLPRASGALTAVDPLNPEGEVPIIAQLVREGRIR